MDASSLTLPQLPSTAGTVDSECATAAHCRKRKRRKTKKNGLKAVVFGAAHPHLCGCRSHISPPAHVRKPEVGPKKDYEYKSFDLRLFDASDVYGVSKRRQTHTPTFVSLGKTKGVNMSVRHKSKMRSFADDPSLQEFPALPQKVMFPLRAAQAART